MTALGVIGIVLLCILGLPLVLILLVLLVLSFKMVLWVKITPEEKEFSISHLFFKKKIYPFPEKKNKSEKPQKKREEKPKEASSEKKSKKSGGMAETVLAKVKALTLPDYVDFLRMFKDGFIKRMRFEKLYLTVNIGTPSADLTAKRYGDINALLFPLLGKLDSAGRIKDGNVSVRPDFTAEKTDVWADVNVSLRIINIFTWAMKVVFKILKK